MTKPEVFIIESLKFSEETDYREGEMIYRSLRMSLKEPIYRYVRTLTEFEHFVEEFGESNYRYLHISCHGSKGGLSMTLDHITTHDVGEIVGPALDGKRLFLSTCLASTPAMAEAVFKNGGCTSLAGPKNKINFDDSVILWTSFYHLMFKANQKAMKRDQLRGTLSKCASTVGEKINFYRPGKDRTALHALLPEPIQKTTVARTREASTGGRQARNG
ncbi:hypothetical protein EOS93_30835 [Rhizobium sp. RMa-01]|uniref:hypothetical protein n=1 Tax=unclassified Rhizobium TaxID=2613769 RepID=UPI0008D8E84D|nr:MULTISPECIES: hypothetical protein [unclassified Rhizobium]OHV22675.1 hypothetical protein BBJ66_29010 [Rhizobium sp. RSm-3]RVU05552.1 hypothetical protein EOS93_30835 [Rhizobium sp. RMa-01]